MSEPDKPEPKVVEYDVWCPLIREDCKRSTCADSGRRTRTNKVWDKLERTKEHSLTHYKLLRTTVWTEDNGWNIKDRVHVCATRDVTNHFCSKYNTIFKKEIIEQESDKWEDHRFFLSDRNYVRSPDAVIDQKEIENTREVNLDSRIVLGASAILITLWVFNYILSSLGT